MRKRILYLMPLILLVSGCSGMSPLGNKQEEEVQEELPPTLEETLGITSDELLQQEFPVNTESAVLLYAYSDTGTIKDTYFVAADDNYRHDVMISTDSVNNVYYDINDGKYESFDFGEWAKSDQKNFDEITMALDSRDYTLTTGLQEASGGTQLLVEGELLSDRGISVLQNYMSEKNWRYDQALFKAWYNKDTRELESMILNLTFDDRNEEEYSGITIEVTPYYNYSGDIKVPSYVIESMKEPEKEQETIEVKEQINGEDPICLAIFNADMEQMSKDIALESVNIDFDKMSENYGVSVDAMLESIYDFSVRYTVNEFLKAYQNKYTPGGVANNIAGAILNNEISKYEVINSNNNEENIDNSSSVESTDESIENEESESNMQESSENTNDDVQEFNSTEQESSQELVEDSDL